MEQTCLEVILERVNNIIKLQEENHKENKEDHAGIIARQDHTNGNVSRLEKWRYLVAGGFMVAYTLLPILIYYRIESAKYELTSEFNEKIQSVLDVNKNK